MCMPWLCLLWCVALMHSTEGINRSPARYPPRRSPCTGTAHASFVSNVMHCPRQAFSLWAITPCGNRSHAELKSPKSPNTARRIACHAPKSTTRAPLGTDGRWDVPHGFASPHAMSGGSSQIFQRALQFQQPRSEGFYFHFCASPKSYFIFVLSHL